MRHTRKDGALRDPVSENAIVCSNTNSTVFIIIGFLTWTTHL